MVNCAGRDYRLKIPYFRPRSSVAEQRICIPPAAGSIPCRGLQLTRGRMKRRRRSLHPTSQMGNNDVAYYPDLEAAFLAACREFHAPLVSTQFREGVPTHFSPGIIRSSCGSPAQDCAGIGDGA